MKKGFQSFVINFVVYICIVAGLVFGMPKFLAWALDTTFPMAAITSGSMWPALKEGDLVFIQGVDPHALNENDIIVYRNRVNNTFTIHRVISFGEDTLITKGDANFNEDAPVAYRDVVGRAFRLFGKHVRIPYLGSITVLANNLKQNQ